MQASCYERLVVAIDVFNTYKPVLARALSLTSADNIYLVHVTLPHTFFEPYATEIGQDFTLEIQQKSQRALLEVASQYDIPVDNVHSRIGNAADEIHEVATSLNAELIVIGTHGKSGLKLLLGSTANAVLHGAKCDVLAVKV